jgi:hypothetical protein
MRKGMMKMTTMLKSSEAAADGIFTEIVWKKLNPDAGRCVLKERAAISVNANERLVAQDALSEMLEEMSLSTLLYYVLAGEGKIADEPA